ncbi:MAG TPA: corrinoid protein [Candidatus Flavonifractor merdigallinarum]|uniref:Corrinoid protein n=1 Tax=Candidatus Flavonifractor merdigallinarum TaxID=2838589 RepID=A0A9D1YAE9_9FIRM|nr:corrinoid protein [Candidatus Flavonifractor merdigallinarum]
MNQAEATQILDEVAERLREGRSAELLEHISLALEGGLTGEEILQSGLLRGINELGEQFKNSEAFVPEVLIAARAMNRGLDLLAPVLRQSQTDSRGTVILGTVRGDIHDIGKKLVRILMEGQSLTVVDLGVDVPAERFYEAAIAHHAQVVGCSALLTTTMIEMKRVVQLFEKQGVRDKVRIMVGGAAVSQRFCTAIGADCYTADAYTAAQKALVYCQELRAGGNGL